MRYSSSVWEDGGGGGGGGEGGIDRYEIWRAKLAIDQRSNIETYLNRD